MLIPDAALVIPQAKSFDAVRASEVELVDFRTVALARVRVIGCMASLLTDIGSSSEAAVVDHRKVAV